MIKQIHAGKRRFMNLLLLADEQLSMIERYLGRGDMFVMYEGECAVAVAVVTDEGGGVCELKNIAVGPDWQGRGLGKHLVEFLCGHYGRSFRTMIVGTGETRRTMGFYERCGFARSHRIKNFFTDNYDHPIVEDGVVLSDMIYFSRKL